MKPASLLTNLAINDILSRSQTDGEQIQPDSSSNISVQLVVLEETLGKAITNCLAKFQFPFKKIQLKSISVLREGLNSFDIIPILKENLEQDIQTIVVGSRSTTFKASFDSLQFGEKFFNASIVQPSAGTGMDKIILDVKRPWLQGLFILANQAHLSDPKFLAQSESEGLRSIRLGTVRSEPGWIEPEIRCSELFGLSLNALKNSEAPIQTEISSTGLAADEACQLLYYAGRSERNRITVIHDFLPSTSKSPIGVNLLATFIWYFLHGLNFRSTHPQTKLTNMKKFSLDDTVQGHHLSFYKDESEQKWWLKSPFPERILSDRMPLIACDYNDYRMAANEQLLTERLNGWFHLYENTDLKNQGL
ncbi:MAG: hypothetical protein KDC53_17490 [Saprospiraceae bacterium]|nr:hypothetical protein [Saprospiraceae bacterium]